MCYREDMVLLLYIDDFLILSTYKDRIDGFYTSLQEYLNIEDDGYIYKYLGIEFGPPPRWFDQSNAALYHPKYC